jgi:SnoaL-like domain
MHTLETASTEDTRVVTAIVDAMFVAFEERDWDRFTDLLADEVELDHTSLGAPLVRLPAGALIDRWRAALHERKRNFHLLSRMHVDLHDNSATVTVNCYAANVLDESLGGGLWEVWGRHVITFGRTASGWRVSGMRFVKSHSRGDDRVHTHTLS